MKIYITRHSLTAWNEEKRLQGWKDSPLTKQGKEDALKLGEYMKTIHIDQVYSSPLLRAKSTARLIFKNENIIEDITFENCKIELTKTSKWQCGLYDLRPCLDYGVESYDNSAFFIRFAKDVTIRKTKTRWGNLCDNYKYAIDAKNVENLLLSDFDGHSVDESMDDYKLDNVSLIK